MVIKSRDDGGDSDGESDSDLETRMLRVADPFDAGNPDGDGRPARYASLADFHFLDVQLKITTDGGPGCGGHIWQSAVVLSRYMQLQNQLHPTEWQNKTAIELGAGTGIVACALASLGIPGLKVWSTDLEQLLPLARQNVTLNQLQDVVEVEELAWGKPLPDTVPHKPDLLLLADCIYLENTFPWLIETMRLLSSQSTEILLCYKKRRKADKRFFIQLKKHFTWEHVGGSDYSYQRFADVSSLHQVQDDPYKKQYEREGLSLFRIKKRTD